MSLMSDLRRLRQARLNRESLSLKGNQDFGGRGAQGASLKIGETPPSDDEPQDRIYYRNQYDRFRNKKPDEVLADWTVAVAVFTGVLAAASVAGDVFSFRTLTAINGQLHEMESGSTQTDKIIAADNKLAIAAKAQADSADNLARITRDNISLSERAWVGPNGATITSTPSIANDVTFIVNYQNTGKEPAIDAITNISTFSVAIGHNGMAYLLDLDVRLQNCKGTDPSTGGQVVFPSTGFSGNQISTKLDKSMITDDVIKGNTMIGVTGCISYRSFARTRHSAYCFFYKTGVTVFPNLNFCSSGGYAD